MTVDEHLEGGRLMEGERVVIGRVKHPNANHAALQLDRLLDKQLDPQRPTSRRHKPDQEPK